jgi:hypothetical protein
MCKIGFILIIGIVETILCSIPEQLLPTTWHNIYWLCLYCNTVVIACVVVNEVIKEFNK